MSTSPPPVRLTVATATDSSWQAESGTSFSTPIVSGAAAWVWTLPPELDNTQLFEVMRRSAADIGPPAGRDDGSGYGLLDVAAALTYPAPLRDPLEPNDDVDFVEPDGGFFSGLGPLTTEARQGAQPAGAARPARGPPRRLPGLAARHPERYA